MIELYLDIDMREQLLNYDFEHSERCYDDVMYYITNTESQILYDIIYSIIYFRKDILERMGFKQEDLEIIEEYDVNIKFTNKRKYYIKEIN